ncbi:MAG: trypsin-like peptidase domain-containing protein [Pirellulales bacterium]
MAIEDSSVRPAVARPQELDRFRWNSWVILFLALCLLYLILRDRWGFGRSYQTPIPPRAVSPRGDLAADEKSTIELFQKSSSSVVFIKTAIARVDPLTMRLEGAQQGTGSGFVWDKDGHIVTNFHVLQNADRATVMLSDQTSWEAELVGQAPEKDLAVLRIKAPAQQLNPIAIGVSKDLQVGQKVFAIGNPFGLDQTLTTGIISALGRAIEVVNGRWIHDVIQTDAAINPGNSGGPLLDSAGRLVGVNTMIYSPSGAYAGIGFAIPVDVVNRIVPQLIRHGRLVSLGIQTLLPSAAERVGVRQGLLVMEVIPGGTAAVAGVRPTYADANRNAVPGDVILQLDDKPVNSLEDVFDFLDQHQVGDRIEIRILRGFQGPNQHELKLEAELLPSPQ